MSQADTAFRLHPLPAYEAILEAIRGLDGQLDPAEAHGILWGLLCTNDQSDGALWLAELFEEPSAIGRQRELGDRLIELYGASVRQLNDETAWVELLLPADDEPMERRAAALAAWCQGFMAGLGLGGFDGEGSLDEQGRGFLRDLAELARLSAGPGEADEEGERAYADLVEYVRAGVQHVALDVAPEPAGGSATLH